MKVLVFLVIFATVAAVGMVWFMDYQVYEDHGRLVAYACGNPREDGLDLQIAVSFGMSHLDPPRWINGKLQTWNEWIADHLELRDEDGTVIRLKQAHFANLIPEAKIGTPDFYAVAKVEPNATYTLDYFPVGKAESKVYRDTFTTTAEGKPFRKAQFDLVEE